MKHSFDLNDYVIVKELENEVTVVNKVKNKVLKIFNVNEIKEKRILKFVETHSLLTECSSFFVYPFKIHQMSNNVVICERVHYDCDIKSVICEETMSIDGISLIMIELSDILMMLCEYGIIVSNLKSSNIVYDSCDDYYDDILICDLCLNELRSSEDMVIDDVCYTSPEELSGSESNEKSVVWSIGCILYEMLNKKLPFKEENDIFKTMNNIMRCKLNDDINVNDDERMKEILLRMLKIENEDRLSLFEFKKEMIKEDEILKDSENNIIMCYEKVEIIFNVDYLFEPLPFYFRAEYYLFHNKYEVIRDELIEKYNSNNHYQIILSILLMMKSYKSDYSIEYKLKFQVQHICKYRKAYYLDEKIFRISYYHKSDEVLVTKYCICLCEEGMKYLFRLLELINPTELKFCIILTFFIYLDQIRFPFESQPLFPFYLSHLSNLQELDLSCSKLTSHFIESFVESIPYMIKLKYVDLRYNLIGPTGFKLLLPYLHLLINRWNELNLCGMSLNDESMILLSSELYKYPNIEKIDIQYNRNIHYNGLKSLKSKLPISKITISSSIKKKLLVDKDIPKIIKFIKNDENKLNLSNSEIDDVIFKTFISLRLNELTAIERLYLRNNKLTSESIEILINSLSSLPKLKNLFLCGNPIGDVGMKILSPHIHLLKGKDNRINCSRMRISSDGLNYLLNGLKSINEKIRLYINENNIDSSGIEYLMNYMKENNNIEKIFIHNNPIGNDGFKLLLNNLDMLILIYYNETERMNLSNILVDDESVILLSNKLDSIERCKTINLNRNNIKMKGLKSICEKSLEKEEYPYIGMKCSNWTNRELEYYLNYCIEKKRRDWRKEYDFSKMNLNDYHISLIKQIDYYKLDLSNNKISLKGLKELTTSLPKYCHISIFGNEIGDEGVEIICKFFDKFVYDLSLNLSNIGMNEKGLKVFIERSKDYDKQLEKIDISGNELNEEELKLINRNEKVFYYLYELSITVKENINRNELKSFLETFSSIRIIKLNGINEEEKKELSKAFFNIE